MTIYAIAGVMGHTGAVAADTLLAQGAKVRVIVRDAAKGAPFAARGAEVAVASLGDAAAMARALDGAAGAFLLLPPHLTAADPLAHNAGVTAALAEAVRAAKLPHVVLLSSVGAQHAAGTGPIRALHHAEAVLGATGAALTAIRAASFMENWGAALAGVPHGVLPTFVPAAFTYAQVATRDIGRTAAAALVEGGRGTAIVELRGPRDYSANDVAAAVAQLAGKPVAPQVGPLDAVVPTFTSYGMSPGMAELYREMLAGIASGHVDFAGGAAREVRGSVPIEDVLRALLAGTAKGRS